MTFKNHGSSEWYQFTDLFSDTDYFSLLLNE